MGNKCSNLTQYTDSACDIGDCVKDVVGYKSSSASPTDIWRLYFKNGVKYEDINVSEGIMKLFISSNNIYIYSSDPKKNIQNLEYKRLVQGLEYEIKVYKYIIRPLIDNKICPNFVRYLGSAENCDINSLINIISSANINYDNLLRNLLYMKGRLNNRPSINDNTSSNNQLPKDEANVLKYNFLITQPALSTFSLSDYINKNYNDNSKYINFLKLYFQVLIVCYAMSLNHMGHNDIHPGNIFVQPYMTTTGNKDNKIVYVINDIIYTLDIEDICLVYDFDRSYSAVIGNNVLLDSQNVKNSSQSNEFFSNRDVIKVSSYIYNNVPYMRKTILDTISPNNTLAQKMLIDVWKQNYFLKDLITKAPLDDNFYLNYEKPKNALENLINIMRNEGIFTNDVINKNDSVYILSEDMFNNGVLDLSKVIYDRYIFIKEKDEIIRQSKDMINNLDLRVNNLQSNLDIKDKEIINKEEEISNKDEEIKLIKEEYEEKIRQINRQFTNLTNNIRVYIQKQEQINIEKRDCENNLEILKEKMDSGEIVEYDKIINLQNSIKQKEEMIKNISRELILLKNMNSRLKTEIEEVKNKYNNTKMDIENPLGDIEVLLNNISLE